MIPASIRRSEDKLRISSLESLIMFVTVLQWLVLATLAGVIVGCGTSLFLRALYVLTDQTAASPLWLQMTLLPLGGLLNGLLLHYGYRSNSSGLLDSTITAVHNQNGRMPLKTIAIKPIAALITLGCGGSAGKEGPCSHIGGSLASGLGRLFRLNPELQKRLVACGVSAGFAGVFGTPIAGALYGVEVLAIGRIRHDFLFPAIIAGVASFETCKFWSVPYRYYDIALRPQFSEAVFLKTVFIGIACGLIAWLFVDLVGGLRKAFQAFRARFGVWPPLVPVLGGFILAVLILFIPTDYLGLSLPLMDRALAGEVMPHAGFFWKTLFVALTLGSGFYGGIVTPQFVIGAVGGNAIAGLLGINPALGAAVGLVSVVAAASNTPISAILMGVELFGAVTGTTYVAGAAIAAYLIIGHRSVYPDQVVAYPKSSWILGSPDRPLGREKLHLSYGFLRWLNRLQIRWRRLSRRGVRKNKSI
jgi:H+/Cl- antiporter ClcA